MKYLIFLLFPITVSAQTQIVIEAGTLDTLVITSGTLVIPTTTVQRKPYKPPIPPSNAFHISTSGNDANPGTLAAPWKTLGRLNGGNFTDKTVLLRRGDMWREQLTIPSSNLIIGAYGTGAKPIINGADLITTWSAAGTNIWSVVKPNAYSGTMVVIDDSIFFEANSLAEVNADREYFITGGRVYIYSITNPNTRKSEISKRDYCIFTAGNAKQNVIIDGIEARYAGRAGIYFEGPGAATSNSFNGNSIVKNCIAYANRSFGMVHVDHYDNVLFEDCQANFNGNGLYSWEADEGTFRRCSTANQIHYEYATGFTDGGAIQGYRSDNWIVENCYSINDYDAIHLDGGNITVHGTVRYNKVYNSRFGNPDTPGFGMGNTGAGSVIDMYYNLAVNCAEASQTSSLAPHLGKVNVYNNTFYHNKTSGTLGIVYFRNGTNYTFKNNIFVREYVAGEYVFVILQTPISTNDYNNYFILNNVSGTLRNYYNGATYSNLPAWKTATGQDANSLSANPLFVSPTDFSLQIGSPCINKGVNVGLTKDINGNQIIGLPDIGAYERN